ncbi:hypothetical protein GCM10027167_38290 [Nocardia heshunensis]
MAGLQLRGKAFGGRRVGDVEEFAAHTRTTGGHGLDRLVHTIQIPAGQIHGVRGAQPLGQAFDESQTEPLGRSGDECDSVRFAHPLTLGAASP